MLQKPQWRQLLERASSQEPPMTDETYTRIVESMMLVRDVPQATLNLPERMLTKLMERFPDFRWHVENAYPGMLRVTLWKLPPIGV